ncbi:hypothetical protein LY474_29980 [Myxococcus stipitatus]|uniref:hypothetical protein n=1 Tax=Myxococcus stipitatus TaxID=83455 RepID=UPI001F36D648|nr:hypothetical protein [Myxococcus stipitatus]MCE9672042.1 hypothetical protein [Myxococcus stipitatus]
MEMGIGLSGSDMPALVRALAARWLPQSVPSKLSVDYAEKPPRADWLQSSLLGDKPWAKATWEGKGWNQLLVEPPVAMVHGHHDKDVQRLLAELAPLPFALASFGSLHSDWRVGARAYAAPVLDDLHFPHGWGCAFKGVAGHSRLVSRRWLEFGPWRLLKGPEDVSLVQFHDLDADSATAFAQAKPGHDRMGYGLEGGVIRSRHARLHDVTGLYDAKTQSLKFIIHGREVPQSEMLDACALRLTGTLGPGQPVKRVAYVFMEARQAREYLHELWLRELECWAIEQGQEVRLDTDYRPTPVKPDWVKALDAREASAPRR